jgi:DNA-binding NtrC family response regulator
VNPGVVIAATDETLATELEHSFESRGFSAQSVTSISELAALLESNAEVTVLIDYGVFSDDIPSLLRAVLRNQPHTTIYLFNVSQGLPLSDSIKLCAAGIFDTGSSVSRLVSRTADDFRLANLMESQGIVGHSRAFFETAATLEQVAGTDVTVLISGESGTGKEMLARALHNFSDRSTGPFVPVNCGAIAEGLIESELFGHEKGAFTGAANARQGYFEAADGGTLFLDEIGELRQDLQVRLLRALEQKSFMRVGGSRQISVDVRVVAASNRDLKLMTEEGKFRDDLYYRLTVVSLQTAPLRERPTDIVPLAESFFASRGRGEVSISPDAIEMLMRYSWPGNIRELRNFVESTLVAMTNERVTAEDVSRFISSQSRSNRQLPVVTGKTRQDVDFQLIYQALLDLAREVAGLRQTIEQDKEVIDFKGKSDNLSDTIRASADSGADITSLRDMERDLIARVLESVGGNRRQAADLLGIGQRTLYRKLREYNLK